MAFCVYDQRGERGKNGSWLWNFGAGMPDRRAAVWDKPRSAWSGSRPLPELFQAAGCEFEFSAKTIQPLTKLLREELEKL
jgi:hypothetical protein